MLTTYTKSATKGTKSLGVKYVNVDSFSILHRTYIRPRLEYCVQAWNTTLQKDILLQDNEQRRATKLLKNLPYTQALHLYLLDQRKAIEETGMKR